MSTADNKEALLFQLYVAYQPCTLAAFAERLHEIGWSMSVGTVRRYSQKYRWQDRLKELQVEARKLDPEALKRVREHLSRSAQLGWGLQGLAGSGLRHLASDPSHLGKLTPQAVARLAESGTRIAEAALQSSRTFSEVADRVADFLVPGVVELFSRVEEITDPKARVREFALGFDRLVDDLIAMGE